LFATCIELKFVLDHVRQTEVCTRPSWDVRFQLMLVSDRLMTPAPIV
jgi:hypothetical protein